MEDLKSKKWDTIGCEIEFSPQNMKSEYHIDVFRATFSSPVAGNPYPCARICVRCGEVYPLEPCANCGYEGFVPGLTTEGVAGIFCRKCEKGFSSWTCENCETTNPISKSLGKEKGGCFIATAVYGTDTASEVIVLKRIREKYLISSYIGRLFVNIYYRFSPPLARLFRDSGLLRRVLGILFVQPLVMLCRRLVKDGTLEG